MNEADHDNIATIETVEELLSLPDQTDIAVHWTFYPHEPAVIWIAASTLHLSVEGREIPESAFWNRFKQFLANHFSLFRTHSRNHPDCRGCTAVLPPVPRTVGRYNFGILRNPGPTRLCGQCFVHFWSGALPPS